KASSYAFFLPGTDRRVNGFGRALSGDGQSEYLAFASTPDLLGNTAASLDTQHFSLQMQHPLEVTRLAGLEVPSGNEVLYVGGDGRSLSEPLAALFDPNADDAADDGVPFSRKELAAFPPAFLQTLVQGQRTLRVDGAFRAVIQVRATDATGTTVRAVLGQARI